MFSYTVNRVRIFQGLVVAGWLLDVFVRLHWDLPDSFLRYLHWIEPDPRVIDLLSGSGYQGHQIVPESIATALFICAYAVATVGMFFVQNWGRHLYLGVTILGFASTALYGMIVLDPGTAMLIGLLIYVEGTILAMAYLGPLGFEFSRKGASISGEFERDATTTGD